MSTDGRTLWLKVKSALFKNKTFFSVDNGLGIRGDPVLLRWIYVVHQGIEIDQIRIP